MTGATPSDFEFLLELIRQIDADPDRRVTGRHVAEAINLSDDGIEPAVRRLKNRGLLDWAPGPKRAGDGWTSTGLAVTPEGYRHDGTGLT